MRGFEYVMYGAASFLVGWFAPHVFTNTQWSGRAKVLNSVAVTVAMFVVLGFFRLSMGEDIAEFAQDVLICPIVSLPHCPGTASKPEVPTTQPAPAPTSSTEDELLWQEAVMTDTVPAYRYYSRKFPHGQHITDARAAIARLQSSQPPPQIEKPPEANNPSPTPSPPVMALPSPAPPPPLSVIPQQLGVEVDFITSAARQQFGIATNTQGVLVTRVLPDGPAAQKNIKEGDIIVEVQKTPTTSPTDLARIVNTARFAGRSTVLVLVNRSGDSQYIALTMGAFSSGSDQPSDGKCVRFNGQTICE